MRIRCELFGCKCGDVPDCDRCGEHLYDDEFILAGRLEPLMAVIWTLLYRAKGMIIGYRCVECRKRFWRGYGNGCCSEKCFDSWIQF